MALYSPCEQYRYGLRRVWNGELPQVLFIMLNPSTATELQNDPTIHRCETRARAMGYGGVMIANLFAFRATKPEDLKKAADPIGPANDQVLLEWHRFAGTTIAAWGVHGTHLDRAGALAAQLGAMSHLGLTKDGHPRHPLYVSYKTLPADWPAGTRYAGVY